MPVERVLTLHLRLFPASLHGHIVCWSCSFLAVSDGFVNNIPTDIRGLTRNRTPQQLINIATLGNINGIGGFFPNGLVSI